MPSLVITIILLIFSIIFAVQNADPVPLKFLLWEFEWPLSLIILLFFAIGLVIGLLAIVPRLIKQRRTHNKERKQFTESQSQTRPPTTISNG